MEYGMFSGCTLISPSPAPLRCDPQEFGSSPLGPKKKVQQMQSDGTKPLGTANENALLGEWRPSYHSLQYDVSLAVVGGVDDARAVNEENASH